MLRKILVPVRGDGKGDNVLAHAAALARRFNAHIEVAHCRPRPEDMIPFGIPIPQFAKDQIAEAAAQAADMTEQGLRDELSALASELNLREEGSTKGPTVSFVEEAGKQVDVIKVHGRLSDLIAVAQPDRDRNIGTNTLKAALFHTGRPVMMCPAVETTPTQLGGKVAIAWNGSLEASRAVSSTIEIVRNADQVTILASDMPEPHGATTEDLVAYLTTRGITPEVHRFTIAGRAGASILRANSDVGADLLIMGAYGDSHERETLFGGNTQTVVDTAEKPVILVH